MPGGSKKSGGADAGPPSGPRKNARLQQPAGVPSTSNSWLGMQAAALGQLPGMAPQTSAPRRGKQAGGKGKKK